MLTNYIFERIERQTFVKIKANYSKKVNLPDTHKVVFPLLLFSVQFEIKPFALQGSTDRLGPRFSKILGPGPIRFAVSNFPLLFWS